MSAVVPPAQSQTQSNTQSRSFEDKLDAAKSSQILVDYMKSQGKSAITGDELKQLAQNKDVPADVANAAAYMILHDQVFEAIETNDVAGADDLSGIWNLEWAAAGGLEGSAEEAIARMTDTFDRAIEKSALITEVTTEKKTEIDATKQRPQN